MGRSKQYFKHNNSFLYSKYGSLNVRRTLYFLSMPKTNVKSYGDAIDIIFAFCERVNYIGSLRNCCDLIQNNWIGFSRYVKLNYNK